MNATGNVGTVSFYGRGEERLSVGDGWSIMISHKQRFPFLQSVLLLACGAWLSLLENTGI